MVEKKVNNSNKPAAKATVEITIVWNDDEEGVQVNT